MAKPGTLPGVVRRPTVETQTHMAHADLKLRWYHLGQPWGCGAALLITAALVHRFAGGPLTALLAGVCGLIVTGVDYHLRSTRIYKIARIIGPVTILSATSWLCYVIAFGWSKPLFLIWLFIIFILGSTVWDIWMASGEHKDENRQFPVAASNAGMDGAWFSGLKRHGEKGAGESRFHLPRRTGSESTSDGTQPVDSIAPEPAPVRGGGLIGTMHLPPGEITPSNAASKVENLEGAMGHPPGSWSLAPDPGNAANTLVKISDPNLLAKSLPWPYGMSGSNPGASIAAPLNPGLWQDGALMEYTLLRHHMLYTGITDSGKTMTAAYNIIGEAISRHDYACLAIDLAKQDQFLGAMRPALHKFATTPEQAFALLDAINRIRPARAAYLASKRQTEWTPGCGLTLLNFWVEEVADLADLIVNTAYGGSKEKLEQWKSDVRVIRSLGGRWDISTGRSDFQEIPTMIRSQMGKVCFGVNSRAEAELGLSDEQRKRGCRPELWKTKYPGKFFIDAPSIPDDRIGMPARGWDWGRDAVLMAEYAEAHPWQERPLDDVTGEALEAVPGPAATSAFPVTPVVTGVPAPAGDTRPGLHLVPPGWRPAKLSKDQTLDMIRTQLAAWRKDGVKHFKTSDLNALAAQMDRTRQHMRNLLLTLAADPANRLVCRDDMRPTQWEILPEPPQKGETGK